MQIRLVDLMVSGYWTKYNGAILTPLDMLAEFTEYKLEHFTDGSQEVTISIHSAKYIITITITKAQHLKS